MLHVALNLAVEAVLLLLYGYVYCHYWPQASLVRCRVPSPDWH